MSAIKIFRGTLEQENNGPIRTGEFVSFHDYHTETQRLRAALKLIAEQTICPELFPLETNEDLLAYKTALTIATAALDKSTKTMGTLFQRLSDGSKPMKNIPSINGEQSHD